MLFLYSAVGVIIGDGDDGGSGVVAGFTVYFPLLLSVVGVQSLCASPAAILVCGTAVFC